jgi:hypothetical protein
LYCCSATRMPSSKSSQGASILLRIFVKGFMEYLTKHSCTDVCRKGKNTHGITSMRSVVRRALSNLAFIHGLTNKILISISFLFLMGMISSRSINANIFTSDDVT